VRCVVCFDTFDGLGCGLDSTLKIHGFARFGEWQLGCLLRVKRKNAHVEPIPNSFSECDAHCVGSSMHLLGQNAQPSELKMATVVGTATDVRRILRPSRRR
jgi:hypothetical protein